jgi:hypothetical protein
MRQNKENRVKGAEYVSGGYERTWEKKVEPIETPKGPGNLPKTGDPALTGADKIWRAPCYECGCATEGIFI